MANKNISGFTAATQLNSVDLIPIWQSGESKHISASLLTYAFNADLVALSGSLVTLSAELSAAAVTEANAYTDTVSGALQVQIDALTPDIFRSEVVSMSGSLLTISSDMSANALAQANVYTDAVSAALQAEIDAIVTESITVTSTGGSISVAQNGTQFNVEVATAPVSNHNDLSNIQGSGSDYFHLNATQFASISGGVDLSAYTPITTIASISSSLVTISNDMSANALAQANAFTDTVSGALDSRIVVLEALTPSDIFRSEVVSMSGSLLTISNDMSANALAQAEAYADSGFVALAGNQSISGDKSFEKISIRGTVNDGIPLISGGHIGYDISPVIQLFVVAPSGSNAAGIRGQVSYISGANEYMYYCVADNEWVRWEVEGTF